MINEYKLLNTIPTPSYTYTVFFIFYLFYFSFPLLSLSHNQTQLPLLLRLASDPATFTLWLLSDSLWQSAQHLDLNDMWRSMGVVTDEDDGGCEDEVRCWWWKDGGGGEDGGGRFEDGEISEREREREGTRVVGWKDGDGGGGRTEVVWGWWLWFSSERNIRENGARVREKEDGV